MTLLFRDRGAAALLFPQEGRGEVVPYKRLMGMCRWMGLHFYDWIGIMGSHFQ